MDARSKDIEADTMYEKAKHPPFGATSLYTSTNPVLRMLASCDRRAVMAVAGVILLGILFAGLNTNTTVLVVMLMCIVMLGFCAHLAQWVLSKDEGTPDMKDVSDAIRDGAEGFFATQYGNIAKYASIVSVIIFVVYLFRQVTPEQQSAGITQFTMAVITTFSFLLGALCSGVAGYVGMWVSVRANVRVSGAARRTAREALQVALRAGGFSGMIVVGMTVFGVVSLYATFHMLFGVGTTGLMREGDVPLMLVGYGFGASFVALFAQLGGGIYTKAADVGADMVGKVEQNIPEDDPRNPAVVADLVGDNVGDCAARGADLFESIAAEIIAAMILGGTMARKAGIEDPSGFILFPLVIHSCDLVVSAIGILSVKGESSNKKEDPYDVMKDGYNVSLGCASVCFVIACRTLLHDDSAPNAWMHFAACGLVGMGASYLYVFISQYYTDYKYKPVRQLADASTTGHGTNVIAGLGLGFESTAMPVIVISISLITAYWLGMTSGLTDHETGKPCAGLFGTAVATMGMLSTAAYVLTMDVFGPIADNAGGIVEMSQQPESVRDITDLLDAVGNTTKATTKGFAIGSAALASFLLFSAYMDEVSSFTGKPFEVVDIAIPEVFVAGLLGSMLVYLFTAWSMLAVGRSAQEVVNEVRRQFAERPGIMSYQEKPDYARCVSIVAASAIKEMVKPGVLAVCGPVVIGVVFKYIGKMTGQPNLGVQCVAGMIMFATVSGILLALFLNTAGGAWDNAKKYIEQGAHGGKGSEAHKAAVTGDTVGDPCKDTAGPSLHVLIKMLATITLVMAPLFID
ncbi:H+-translocating diphosphatase [Pycnococcus provasolii]|mmetsp:Transcript_15693/g.39769  ORF Transcript_15693/g.39769 Transcript_15693/m.39769 type:complete len:801 (+) Transcript_15693:330-2732(+)